MARTISQIIRQTLMGLNLPDPQIWDADLKSDVDDVGAIAIGIKLTKLGYVAPDCLLLSNSQTVMSPAMSGMFAFYGVNCPISSGPVTAMDSGTNSYAAAMTAFGKNTIASNTGLLNSVQLARKKLANVPDKSRTWLCLGFLVNIQDFLQSPPDAYSPLTGKQLWDAKIKRLVTVLFDFNNLTAVEFNSAINATARAATAYVLANIGSTPIFNVDFNLGNFPTFSSCLVTPTISDITAAAYNAATTKGAAGRRSWDPMGMFVACAPSLDAAGLLATPGDVTFDSVAGTSRFTPNPVGRFNRLDATVNKRALQIALDSLINQSATEFPIVNQIDYSTPNAPSTYTDYQNIVAMWHPADVGVADAAPVTIWPERFGRFPLRQPTSGQQPTYAAALGGKNAVSFLTDDSLFCTGVSLPHPFTLYMRIYQSAQSGTTTLFTCNNDTVASNNSRSATVEMQASGIPRVSSTCEYAYSIDPAAQAVANTTWTTLMAVVDLDRVEMLVNNVSNGFTFITETAFRYINA